MRNRLFGVVTIALLLIGAAAAQQPSADAALQAAIRTETVTGDLRKALAAYQEIVDKYEKADRAVAATALVRMAECHEKLGSAEAAKLFQRVIREFPDQIQAVQKAHAKLGRSGTGLGSGMASRQIWTGPGVDAIGRISPDGRFISHTDYSTGDLAIRDLSTGTSRRLTDKGPWTQSSDYSELSVISGDGSQVAYAWFNSSSSRYELRILKTDVTPGTQPRIVFNNADVAWIAPGDWSPDGKRLAVQLKRLDRTAQIGIVSVQDGAYTPLKSTDWRGASGVLFSPDGSLLAYDLPQSDPSLGRDVYLLQADGTGESVIAQHRADDVVVGWSQDAKTLLFTSDRAGSTGLWSVHVTGGRQSGAPALIKADLGGVVDGTLGMTRGGTLAYSVRAGAPKVVVVGMDFATGKRVSEPVFPFETYLSRINQADWSPDGALVVAKLESPRLELALTIRTSEGRPVRNLSVDLSYFQRPRWAPDGSITVQGRDLKGRQGIYRVDSKTGLATPILVNDSQGNIQQASWTPDGKSLVFRRNGEKGQRVVVREVASGTERTLVEQPLAGPSLSNDGRHLAYLVFDRDSKTTSVYTMAIEGGRSTFLAKVAGSARNASGWTPDGRWVIFAVADESAKPSLWSVAATGGPPQRLSIDDWNGGIWVRVHPDGRQLVYETGALAHEIWTLENFLAASTAKSSRR